MKSFLFKPPVWQGKLNALKQYGEAQTRRLDGLAEINNAPDEWELMRTLNDGRVLFWVKADSPVTCGLKCPENYGGKQCDTCPRLKLIKPRFAVGDYFYVKEAWATMNIFDDCSPSQLGDLVPIWYSDTDVDEPTNCGDDKGKARSPMFMPARFARHFGQITAVDCQRLKDITEPDALKEGITQWLCVDIPFGWVNYQYPHDSSYRCETAVSSYLTLWDSINPQYPSSINPYLFKYTFKLVTREEAIK